MLPPVGAIIGGAIVICIIFAGWVGLKILSFIFVTIPTFVFDLVTYVWPMLLLGIGLTGNLDDEMSYKGPYIALFLQVIPFLLAYWVVSRVKPTRVAKGATALILIGLYIASNLHTGIFAAAATEIMFRQTEAGKAFPKVTRRKILECQNVLGSIELDAGKLQAAKMYNCQNAMFEVDIDKWCSKFFAQKKPFTDYDTRLICRKRSGRLAKVEDWPVAPSARGPIDN